MLQTSALRPEQPAAEEAEAARLTAWGPLVATTAPLSALRDLALAVRRLFPAPAYLVGCGSSPSWLPRAAAAPRLAFILHRP